MTLSPHLDGKTHIIWDWNGTLLDDVTLCVDIIGTMLTEHGLPLVTMDQYKRQFRFPVVDYYRELGFDFQRTPFESLSEQFMRLYRERVGACDLFAGRPEMLAALRENGLRHVALSAAKETYLHAMLAHYGIDHHFDHAFGIADDHAHGKIKRGQELMATLRVPASEMLLIGDTDHDLEVGMALGVDVVLVGDGHQCPAYLATKHAHVLRRLAI